MKMVVEHLAAELSKRYVHYLETLLVDLSIDEDTAEFRVGFSLRSDHRLRQATLQAQADERLHAVTQALIVQAVFEEVEALIDVAVAAERHRAN